MQNSREIFELALGLSSPWSVEKVSFESKGSQRELHITISFAKGHKFLGNDGNSYGAYDRVERSWKHLNFFEHTCYIHAQVPRIRYDGKVETQEVPWARKGSGFTLLFEAFSMLLIESEMPVSKVATTLSEYPQRIWHLFSYWVDKAHKKEKVDSLSHIGFDETSRKKGHTYVTTLVDMKSKRVVYACEGKDSSCIKEGVSFLKEKNIPASEITDVCIDMSPAFIKGCKKYLPDAAITFDRFHVVKEVNKAVNEVRKSLNTKGSLLKGQKFVFLKNRLTDKQFSTREELFEKYPELDEAYELKELFNIVWNLDNKQEAEGFIDWWNERAKASSIKPMVKLAKTIERHKQGILNYISSKITNGVLEGINSKIQVMKRRARGYKKVQNFINMIYFTCGKLTFDYPPYIT